MKAIVVVSVITFSVLLFSGCAEYQTIWPGSYYPGYSADPLARADLDELLKFGSELASKPAASRSEECQSLLKRQKQSPSVGVQLHLLVGRLLSDGCGDIPRILDAVDAIPARNLPDWRVRQLVAIHTEALKRLSHVSRKLGSLERKQKSVPSVSEPKHDETRILREKLEAIRALEKRLDQTGGGN